MRRSAQIPSFGFTRSRDGRREGNRPLSVACRSHRHAAGVFFGPHGLAMPKPVHDSVGAPPVAPPGPREGLFFSALSGVRDDFFPLFHRVAYVSLLPCEKKSSLTPLNPQMGPGVCVAQSQAPKRGARSGPGYHGTRRMLYGTSSVEQARRSPASVRGCRVVSGLATERCMPREAASSRETPDLPEIREELFFGRSSRSPTEPRDTCRPEIGVGWAEPKAKPALRHWCTHAEPQRTGGP